MDGINLCAMATLLFIRGKQSRELNRLFTSHLALVKTGTAVLFVLLAILIVMV